MPNLLIKQEFEQQTPAAYRRELNISEATATARFTIGGTEFTRLVFASAPDQLLVVRQTASKPGLLNFAVATSGPLRYQHVKINNQELALRGKAPAQVDPSYYNQNKDPIL